MCVACIALRKPKYEITEAEFRSGFASLLAKAQPNTLRDSAFFSVPANQPPWLDTGLELQAGERVSIFTVGEAILSRELNLSFHPDMQLWCRIGEAGHIFRGTRNSHSFTAEVTGRLFLGSYFPGEWSTRTGAVSVGTEAYHMMQGGIIVCILRWAAEPLEGLQRLAAFGDVGGLLALEIDRLENAVKPPQGWEYLWFLGPAEIYSVGQTTPGKHPSIACHTHRDAAILHKDVSVPLTRDTFLRWSWKVDELPLIANTMFRQQEGRCEFGAIELQSGDTVLTVN
jgi:hypothetical protein